MKILKVSLIVLLALIAVDSAFAGTMTIGEIDDFLITNEGSLESDGGVIHLPDENRSSVSGVVYDIFVEGDLYLDYSVFGSDQELNITGNITMYGETITIFSPEQKPTIPDLSTVAFFQNPYQLMHETGDVILFSETTVENGTFEATGSIFLGNYSSLTPVPLPASLLLLVAGIAACGMIRNRRNAL